MTTLSPKLVDLFRIHERVLFVYEYAGHQYLNAKDICDFAGLTWRSAKRTLANPRNAKLFGIVDLTPSQSTDLGDTSVTKTDLSTPLNPVLGDLKVTPLNLPLNLIMRVDRVYLYLAGISTDRMLANGKEDEADFMANLQLELAEALHSYETKGIAIKNPVLRHKLPLLKELNQLIRSMHLLQEPKDRSAIHGLIHTLMRELGCDIDTSPDLFTS